MYNLDNGCTKRYKVRSGQYQLTLLTMRVFNLKLNMKL